MSWSDVREYLTKNDLAFLPIGSTEQHGPHNPLGTDHLIAEKLAVEASKRTRVICLPTIPFGVSGEHRHFPGTIFIKSSNFKEFTKDICNSLFLHGIKKIIIVNAHGGNLSTLKVMANELREEEKAYCIVFQWFEIANFVSGNLFEKKEMDHAGAMETAMNLSLHPTLVRKDRIPQVDFKLVRRSPGVYLPWETVYYTESGVFGSSKGITRKKGLILFEAILNKLCDLTNEIKKKPWDALLRGD